MLSKALQRFSASAYWLLVLPQLAPAEPVLERRHVKDFSLTERAIPAGYTSVGMGIFASQIRGGKLATDGLQSCLGVAIVATNGQKLLGHISPTGTGGDPASPGDFNAQIAAIKTYMQNHQSTDFPGARAYLSIPGASGSSPTNMNPRTDMINALHTMCNQLHIAYSEHTRQNTAMGTGSQGEMRIDNNNNVYVDGSNTPMV